MSNEVSPDLFFTFMRPYCVDAPDALLDQAIRQASVWFARESRVLEDEVEIHFQPNVRDYVIPIPEGRDLISVDMTHDGLYGRNRGEFNPATQFYFTVFGLNDCQYRWRRDGRYHVIEFDAPATRDHRHHIWYFWTPFRDACTIPRLFYEDYQEALTFRALSDILAVPKQDWTNMRMAETFAARAEEALTAARNRRFSNYTQGPRRMRARPFVRGARYPGLGGYGVGLW